MPGRALPPCFLMGGITLPWKYLGSRPTLAAGTSPLQDSVTSARLGCLLRYDRLGGTDKAGPMAGFVLFSSFLHCYKNDLCYKDVVVEGLNGPPSFAGTEYRICRIFWGCLQEVYAGPFTRFLILFLRVFRFAQLHVHFEAFALGIVLICVLADLLAPKS